MGKRNGKEGGAEERREKIENILEKKEDTVPLTLLKKLLAGGWGDGSSMTFCSETGNGGSGFFGAGTAFCASPWGMTFSMAGFGDTGTISFSSLE